jgi:hypothetical protein
MPGGPARSDVDVEEVLLAALARSGEAPITRPNAVLIRLRSHLFGGRAARESSMIRVQSCG